jgi:hypothetical protein
MKSRRRRNKTLPPPGRLLGIVTELDDIDKDINADTIVCRPYNYRDKLDNDIAKIEELRQEGTKVVVYFVDCCPYGTEGYFEKFHSLLGVNFIIIDHHKTALEYIDDFKDNNDTSVNGLFSYEYSGCELAWIYTQKWHSIYDLDSALIRISDNVLGSEMPGILSLAGTYDTWRKKSSYDWDKEVMPFQYWLRSEVPDITDIVMVNELVDYFLQGLVNENELKSAIKQGEAILNYIISRNKKIFDSTGCIYKTDFTTNKPGVHGTRTHTCHIVTDYFNNSTVFSDNGAYDDPNMVYVIISANPFSEKMYKISLYSIEGSTIDVSEIASAMGGGGHFHAAGFEAKKIALYHINEKEEGIYIGSDVKG